MTDSFDVNDLLQQAMAMQKQLADAQQQAASAEVTGTAGGGSVTVTMTGASEVTAVHIDPAVVDPDDVEMLEDLVLAAIHDAARRAAELQQTAFGGLTGLGDIAGLGELGHLPGLGELPGAPEG
jgi:DNA-binding YbaB/EbfC family protein